MKNKEKTQMQLWLKSSSINRRYFAQEYSIAGFQELVCKLMKKHNLTNKDLADKINKTEQFINNVFDGTTHPTSRIMSDILFVMGYQLKFSCRKLHF
jgi:ribosome-binding protein aMBF1 (putative translation factor)